MLRRDCKLLIGLFVLGLSACSDKEVTIEYNVKKAIVEKIGLKNFDPNIYKNAKDSVKFWAACNLKQYADCATYSWQLDSCMIFNKSKTRLIMALYSRTVSKETSVADDMNYFYGAKFNNSWFFFRGANYIIPRELYIDTSKVDIHLALSFYQLHKISLGLIYSNYISVIRTNNSKQQFIINNDIFEEMMSKNPTGKGYGSCLNCKTEEEYVTYLIKKNWRQKDTTLNLK